MAQNVLLNDYNGYADPIMDPLANVNNNNGHNAVGRRPERERIALINARACLYNITDNDMIQPEALVQKLVEEAAAFHQPISVAQRQVLTLHVLCVVGVPGILERFLIDFRQMYGGVATELLLNASIFLHIECVGPVAVTPVLCALMWNNQPQVLRLLYTYGAYLHIPDESGIYPEEKIALTPYYNHLFVPPTKNGYYWRLQNDYAVCVQEAGMIAGEVQAPMNWEPPERLQN